MPTTMLPRHYARTTRSYRVSNLLPSCLALLGLAALSGCGGGGGGSKTTPPPTSAYILNGTVTDPNSAPIVGATIKFGSLTTTSTQNGLYRISNVIIPSGQTSLVGTVTATTSVKGVAYSGQNQAVVLLANATTGITTTTNNVQIVMSPTSSQGSIIGSVKDSTGKPVAGALVYANMGPYTSAGVSTSPTTTTSPQYFSNLGSFTTTTRSDGSYTLAAIPPGTPYTVTASLSGQINQTVYSVTVSANSSTTVPLVLSTGTSAALPAPTDLAAQSITAPAAPTRAAGAAGTDAGFMNVIRQLLMQKRGLLAHRSAVAQSIMLHRNATRDTPSGSIIETDIFWDYQPATNLYGFDMLRSPLTAGNFSSIATVRDPLADRYADSDPILTPDTLYYYSIAALDTVNFPLNGAEGTPASPVAVEPLNALSLVSPTSGSRLTSSTPTFTWNAVHRSVEYLVLVYDQFPSLQSDTDTNGVIPIWSSEFSGTTGTYTGPALTSGHTYYWAVVGQDNLTAPSAFTLSPLQTFIAP